MASTRSQLNVRIDEVLYTRVQNAAQLQGQSINAFVTDAVTLAVTKVETSMTPAQATNAVLNIATSLSASYTSSVGTTASNPFEDVIKKLGGE